MLYKPKSILFCNVDSKNYYKWWNFAAIIDYLILIFYAIFFICFALATTLDQNFISEFYRMILFIISILLGFIHLYFEIQQCLWKPKIYFNDPLNLFGK
jgi:hypothetical protein